MLKVCILALCVTIGAVHGENPHQTVIPSTPDITPLLSPPLEASGQFGASVFLGGPWDWEPQGGGPSRCLQMVDTAAASNAEIARVQFIPTLYWWDTGPAEAGRVDASCSGTGLSDYYCYNRFNATTVAHWCAVRADGDCPEISAAQAASLRANVEECMRYASSKVLELAVNARVDDGRALGGWRNTLNFSPTQTYGAFSYESAVLNPLADALAAAAAPGAPVEFTLQGEMGATLFFHPREWIEVVGRVRDRIAAARQAGGNPGPVAVGLGINNSKACGCEYIGIVDGNQYLGNLSATFDAGRYPDLPGVKAAYEAADFLSVSAYVPMPTPTPEPCLFEGLLQRMDVELGLYGISLKGLEAEGVVLRWGEFGVGGGTSNNGDAPARTAAEAAYTPFFGIQGPYTCGKDPFDLCHPDKANEVRDYRRAYYTAAAEYLGGGGCEYTPPGSAYVWGTGSFDALAIYPGDRSAEGSWEDPVVTGVIGCRNAAAQGRAAPRGCGAAGAAPAPEGW